MVCSWLCQILRETLPITSEAERAFPHVKGYACSCDMPVQPVRPEMAAVAAAAAKLVRAEEVYRKDNRTVSPEEKLFLSLQNLVSEPNRRSTAFCQLMFLCKFRSQCCIPLLSRIGSQLLVVDQKLGTALANGFIGRHKQESWAGDT